MFASPAITTPGRRAGHTSQLESARGNASISHIVPNHSYFPSFFFFSFSLEMCDLFYCHETNSRAMFHNLLTWLQVILEGAVMFLPILSSLSSGNLSWETPVPDSTRSSPPSSDPHLEPSGTPRKPGCPRAAEGCGQCEVSETLQPPNTL